MFDPKVSLLCSISAFESLNPERKFKKKILIIIFKGYNDVKIFKKKKTGKLEILI